MFDKTAGGGSLAKDALAAAAADKEAILAAVAELRAELKDVGSGSAQGGASTDAAPASLKPSASAAHATRARAEAPATSGALAADVRESRAAAAAATADKERAEGELLASQAARAKLEEAARETQLALADAENELMAQDLTVAQLRNELRQTHEAASACDSERVELRRRLQRRAAALGSLSGQVGSASSPMIKGLRRVASAERRLILSEAGGGKEDALSLIHN